MDKGSISNRMKKGSVLNRYDFLEKILYKILEVQPEHLTSLIAFPNNILANHLLE